MTDYDADLIREAWEEKRRDPYRCRCGYPDMPGQCPGPANCPLQQKERED